MTLDEEKRMYEEFKALVLKYKIRVTFERPSSPKPNKIQCPIIKIIKPRNDSTSRISFLDPVDTGARS